MRKAKTKQMKQLIEEVLSLIKKTPQPMQEVIQEMKVFFETPLQQHEEVVGRIDELEFSSKRSLTKEEIDLLEETLLLSVLPISKNRYNIYFKENFYFAIDCLKDKVLENHLIEVSRFFGKELTLDDVTKYRQFLSKHLLPVLKNHSHHHSWLLSELSNPIRFDFNSNQTLEAVLLNRNPQKTINEFFNNINDDILFVGKEEEWNVTVEDIHMMEDLIEKVKRLSSPSEFPHHEELAYFNEFFMKPYQAFIESIK